MRDEVVVAGGVGALMMVLGLGLAVGSASAAGSGGVTICVPTATGASVTVGACPTPSPAPTPQPTPQPTPVPTPTPQPSAVLGAGPWTAVVGPSPTVVAGSAGQVAQALGPSGGTHLLGKLQVSTHPVVSLVGPAAAMLQTDDTTPVYVAHNTDPGYVVHCMYYSNCPIEGVNVNIPLYARAGGNLGYTVFTDDGVHDQHMAVVNADTGQETDLWLAPIPSGQAGSVLSVGYGGRFPAGSGGVGSPGATAAGFALASGLVTAGDLVRGYVPHAIFLITPCENGYTAPAVGGDQGASAGCPMLGARVWLDATPQEIAAAGVPLPWRPILVALHVFGGYLGDRCTQCSLGVAFASGLPDQVQGFPSPWEPIVAAFPGEVPSGPAGEYHIPISTGSLDMSTRLHIIAYP